MHFFITKNPNQKIKKKFRGCGAGWGGGGVGGEGRLNEWTVEQAQTSLPLQLLRSWEHDNAFMYTVIGTSRDFSQI